MSESGKRNTFSEVLHGKADKSRWCSVKKVTFLTVFSTNDQSPRCAIFVSRPFFRILKHDWVRKCVAGLRLCFCLCSPCCLATSPYLHRKISQFAHCSQMMYHVHTKLKLHLHSAHLRTSNILSIIRPCLLILTFFIQYPDQIVCIVLLFENRDRCCLVSIEIATAKSNIKIWFVHL